MGYGAGVGAGLVLWRLGGTRVWAQPLAGDVLDAGAIPKFVTPLVIPPAMPLTSRPPQLKRKPIDYYEIAVRQFEQQILPASAGGKTTVWSYGSVAHPATFNYPAFTIEADWRRPVRVKWINGLVDSRPTSSLTCCRSTRPFTGPIPRRRARAGRPRQRPGALPGAGPDRHPPPRRAQQRGERRLSGGLVPPARPQHPRRLRPDRLVLPALPGRGAEQAASGVDARQRGVRVRQRPARLHDVVPRPHARHDARQRLRRAGRVLPAARRPRRRGGRDASGPAPALGIRPGRDYFEIPLAIQDRTFTAEGQLFYPDSRAFFEGLEPSQLQIPGPIPPAAATATWRRSGTPSSSATRSW